MGKVLIINKSTSEWEDTAINYLNKHPIYFIQSVELRDPQLTLEKAGDVYRLRVSENQL